MVAFYIGCSQGSVNVFYSLHWRLSTMSKRIVADILMWKDCTIAVNYMDVQWQSAWRRCWSWAIFAQVFSTIYTLCWWQPIHWKIPYHQPNMRSHLVRCITDERELSGFAAGSSVQLLNWSRCLVNFQMTAKPWCRMNSVTSGSMLPACVSLLKKFPKDLIWLCGLCKALP